MIVNNNRQLLANGLRVLPVAQLLQPQHLYLHLSADVRDEDHDQDERRRSHVESEETRHTVSRVDQLEDRAGVDVEESVVTRMHQPPASVVPFVLKLRQQRYDRVVRYPGGINENQAQSSEIPADRDLLQHDPPMLGIPHPSPIVLHVLDAAPERSAPQHEVDELDHRERTVTRRTEQFDFHHRILLRGAYVQGNWNDEE